jgi:hypothetical protein
LKAKRQKDRKGIALIKAAKASKVSKVKKLLSDGADVNFQDLGAFAACVEKIVTGVALFILSLLSFRHLSTRNIKGSAPAADPGRVFDILWCGDLSALVVLYSKLTRKTPKHVV